MKNLILSLFVLFLFSCKKEPCQFGTIQIENAGNVPATVYSIASHPIIYPGESISQEVEICSGFDQNGNECGDGVQTVVSFKFDNGEMQSQGVVVSRCQNVPIRIN